MVTPARRLAASVLDRVQTATVTLGDALADDHIQALDERERGFLHELVMGSLRRQGWLDHVVETASGRPLEKTRPAIRTVLRLGAYQLLYLRVPSHAAVSESVDLAKRADPRGRASGFVNAVLRKIQKEGPPAEPDPMSQPLEWLTTAGSLPEWLARRWMDRNGAAETVTRARALLAPPPTGLRFNPRASDVRDRVAQAGVELEETGVPGAFEVLQGSVASLAADGLVYVQDVGSQLVAHLAKAKGRTLDACAAPGGKTLFLADEIGPQGRVVAVEPSRRRLRTLATLRDRWGAGNVSVVGADALTPPFAGTFDAVLVDAPCTGLGTLGRRPDIRWRLASEDIPRHAARQRALLEALHELVRPGGRLVYSTCSVEDEENEGVVESFLADHAEFRVETLPEWCHGFAVGPFVKMDPARHRGDAFFAARLLRRE